ncbi:MAG: YedE-related selenium metabolism membrane protein [Lachnospiraceae bacterium]|nr:YedE-related selenium metabolism membrane protein [Lachnospiraceae bacterium]
MFSQKNIFKLWEVFPVKKNEKLVIIIAGIIIGIIASVLVVFGNPANMGFCIACFLRDTAGALGLHRAAPVQYIRPEIIGIILGSFGAAFATKEFKAQGGSAPLTRFVIAFFVMIGCLMFLGCPFRMIIRLAGGDLNALIGLVGFVLGIGVGTFVFLNKGYSLKRTYAQPMLDGFVMPVIQVIVFALLVAAPAFIFFSEAGAGPGAKHAAIAISLVAGLVVGVLAQRTRLCMVGGFRDLFLFKQTKLLLGFLAIFVSALVTNVILTVVTDATYFNFAFAGQPVAHTDGVWNFLGMFLVGFGCILLGGCPLRQLVLSGEGNTDSAITVLGLIVGAAFCHNFGLASSADGPTLNGKIAVIIGIVVVAIIGVVNTYCKKEA